MTDHPVAKALHDGLDTLRERGMAKFEFETRTGQVCARGALMIGAGLPVCWGSLRELPPEADRLLCNVAIEQYPERCTLGAAIVCVNNHPDTTQEDMERIFEKAIVKAWERV